MSNPGKYRHLVVIEQKAEPAQSSTGAVGPPTWVRFASAYASIKSLKGSLRAAEIIAAGQEKPITYTVIEIRGVQGVVAGMRVRHMQTGKVYDIKTVELDDTLTWELTLYVQSGLNQG